jgi:hypothetical protein
MADTLIKECSRFSDINLLIVVLGLATYAIFVGAIFLCVEFTGKSSRIPKLTKIVLATVLVVTVINWLIEPLSALFSSFSFPNFAYMIGVGTIPNSDVARLSTVLIQLDRFRLFSRSFILSFRMIVLATSVLVASLSLSRLSQELDLKRYRGRQRTLRLFSFGVISSKSGIRKRLLFSFC